MRRPRGAPGRTHRPFRATIVALLACFALAIPVGLVAGSPIPATRSLGSATEAPTVSFAERAGFSAPSVLGVTYSGPASGAQRVVVTFEPTQSGLFDPPGAGTGPLSPTAVANEYGLSPSAYDAAESYFEGSGLTVSHAWADRLSLSLVGSTTAIDRAFGTTLGAGVLNGRPVTYPESAPSLPAALESEVSSVVGLTTGMDAFTLPTLPMPSAANGSSDPAQNPDDLITPGIARDIYDISGLYNVTSAPTYATSEGIVLLLWGAGYAPSDIQTFFSQDYPGAFPEPKVAPYPVDGAPAPSASAVKDPSNGSRELTLDLEWSGSMAPGATLDAVYAPAGPASQDYSPTDASLVDALNTAVNNVAGVSAISMSFGSADGADASLENSFESDFAVAAKEGITLFAATGDFGGDAAAGCTGGVQPDYPAASPQVVAVGGTSVTLNRTLLGSIAGFSESAWSQSGGGFATDFAAPGWQEVGSAAAPIEANGHRGMPDVAATAGYDYLYFDGQPAAGGGTSFATPLWAGMITEMDALRAATVGGPTFGFLAPALYSIAANESGTHRVFHDVTTGGNCLGNAGSGWDTATGWGSPDGMNLFVHLVSSFVNVTLTASPSPVAPGGTVTISVTVTNSTSGGAIAGMSVQITLSSSGLGGPCSGTFGSVQPITDTNGRVVGTISVPVCYLGSRAVAAATVEGSGHFGTSSTTVIVNLLGLAPSLVPLSHYPDNVVLFVVMMAVAITIGAVLGRRRGGSPSAAVTAPPPVPPPVEAPTPAPSPEPSPPAPQ